MYSDWVIPQAAMPSAVAVQLEPAAWSHRTTGPVSDTLLHAPFAIYLIQDPSSSCTKHQFTTLNPNLYLRPTLYSWRPPCLQTLIHPTSRTKSQLCCLTSSGRQRQAGCVGEAPSPLHIEPEVSSPLLRTSPAILGSVAQTIEETDNRSLRSL